MVTEVVRELSGPIERNALGLDQGLMFDFYSTERALQVAEVVGAGTGARELDKPLVAADDPFRTFRLEESLGLGESQRVASINFRVGNVRVLDDPVIDALNDYGARAKDVNAIQRRLQLQLDAAELEQADALATSGSRYRIRPEGIAEESAAGATRQSCFHEV